MLLVLLQLDLLAEIIGNAVYPAAHIAGAAGILEDLGVLAFLAPDNGGQHLDAGGLGQGEDLVDDLVDGLLLDLLAADGTVGRAHPCPQQTQVVVDFGHGTHGGAGVFTGRLLVNGDSGRKAVDVVQIWLFHLAQKHPGVGAQGFHIPALTLGVDGVEGQGRLARTGQAGEHHQLVPGDGQVDVFQVVLPGPFDLNKILHSVVPLS